RSHYCHIPDAFGLLPIVQSAFDYPIRIACRNCGQPYYSIPYGQYAQPAILYGYYYVSWGIGFQCGIIGQSGGILPQKITPETCQRFEACSFVKVKTCNNDRSSDACRNVANGNGLGRWSRAGRTFGEGGYRRADCLYRYHPFIGSAFLFFPDVED